MIPQIGQSGFYLSNSYLNFQQSIKNTLCASQNHSLYPLNKERIFENLQIDFMLWSDFPLVEGEIMQFH